MASSGGQDVHWYAAGERLPTGIEAYAGREHNDLVLWKRVSVRSSRVTRSPTSEQVSR